MKIEKCIKEAFVVIGKEGSTEDGSGFIRRLWADANAHFAEVSHLAKKDENGNLLGIWGAMSDFSHSFNPWEDGIQQGAVSCGYRVRGRCDRTGGLDEMGHPRF